MEMARLRWRRRREFGMRNSEFGITAQLSTDSDDSSAQGGSTREELTETGRVRRRCLAPGPSDGPACLAPLGKSVGNVSPVGCSGRHP
jgi:hypothetical protein